MNIFHYHPETNVYLGTSVADESPLEPGVFLFPAYSTNIEPPAHQNGFVRKYVNNSWGYSPIEDVTTTPTEEPINHTPIEISDRQFFHILAIDGLITEEEALAAVKTGESPAAFNTLINSLPLADQFNARMLLEGATTFKRNHPLTDAFGTMYGMTSEQIDSLWQRASIL